MKCTYINLDWDVRRKELMEEMFSINKLPSWELSRFSAVSTSDLDKYNISGPARPTEKANYLSHKFALKERLYEKGHYLVFEDDILIGKNTCKTIESILEQLNSADWDIIYCEICVPNEYDMIRLVRLRQQLTEQGKSGLIDLKGFSFAGATALIVNSKSKKKLYDLLDKNTQLYSAMDLYIRKWVNEDRLKAYCIFPFATSFSEEADVSGNVLEGDKATEMIWLLYRRLIWAERDLSREKKYLDYINENLVDEESAAFGTVLSAMLNKNYKPK